MLKVLAQVAAGSFKGLKIGPELYSRLPLSVQIIHPLSPKLFRGLFTRIEISVIGHVCACQDENLSINQSGEWNIVLLS